jgi:hypothetical protein
MELGISFAKSKRWSKDDPAPASESSMPGAPISRVAFLDIVRQVAPRRRTLDHREAEMIRKATKITIAENEKYAYRAAEAARKAAGRYTLAEAAAAISAGNEARYDQLLTSLKSAALAGELLMYYPGLQQTYHYGDGRASRVRETYEEAYWDDFNAWLDNNERRIGFRFPEPDGGALRTKAKNSETKQQQMNRKFLTCIHGLGLDPRALPAEKRGYPGVRSKVAKALNIKMPNKRFENSWDRALKDDVFSFKGKMK